MPMKNIENVLLLRKLDASFYAMTWHNLDLSTAQVKLLSYLTFIKQTL